MLTSNKCLDLLVGYLQLSLKLTLTKAWPKRCFSLPVIFTLKSPSQNQNIAK